MSLACRFFSGWWPVGPLCLWVTMAPGQTAPEVPEYEAERAKEDYRYLATDSGVPPDVFDPIKFIALSRSKTTYLSIGGEIRQQYELLHNAGWGEEPEDRNGYLLQRYLLHTDWHFGRNVRVFGQLKSGLTTGKRGTPDLPDEDQLDLHQAFMDVSTGGAGNALTLRLGRQEMSYGSSRLISLREGPTVRQTFDGARVMGQSPRGRLEAFVTRPATTKPGIFDDEPNPEVWFWGVYGVRLLARRAGGLDGYYLGFANRQARFAQGRAAERRHSVGFRWWGAPGAFRYNAEAVYQFGRFGVGTIRAGTVSSEVGYGWQNLPLAPALTLRAEYISGDRNLADPTLQTFNPLFPKGAYFGQVALVGPANLFDLHPILTLHPLASRNLTIRFDWAFFWRASRADGFYTTPYVLARSGTRAQSAYIGDQLTVEAEWPLQRHLQLEVFVTQFRAGTFLRESGTGRNLTYLSPRVTFLF
ncbi:alginate export family protein [Hymenobacter sp.]|uniref:alginate export family protein n=1 Tax=Hymenobacter sp. TaxID=1898978 RepID=UPI00286C88C6|nr:alginate export family protein [Hymenobacter sp.]